MGEIAVANDSEILKTVLGSCVAISAWHPNTQTAWLCHYLLARSGEPNSLNPKYGDGAFRRLILSISERQVPIAECQLSIFGGASVVREISSDVGFENSKAAIRMLDALGIIPFKIDVGGNFARSLSIDSKDGRTEAKRISDSKSPIACEPYSPHPTRLRS